MNRYLRNTNFYEFTNWNTIRKFPLFVIRREKKKYVFLLSAFYILLFSSCGDFQDITFSGIENVKITSLTQKGVEAEIIAKIKNPNSLAFTIYKSDVDVVISGMNAGKARLADNVRIKAKSEESYSFKVKSDFSDLSAADLTKLFSIAMSKNVKVGLKGNLKVGKLFVKRYLPVDISQSVPLGGK